MTPLTSVPVHFDRSRSPRLVGDIARELESSGVVDFFQTYDQLTNLLPNALWTPEVTPLSELSADNDSFADGLLLAAFGMAATEGRLGVSWTTDAVRRGPAELAQSMLTLANAASSTVLMLGAGELKQCRPYGYKRAEGLARLEDHLRLLPQLFEATGPIDFEGNHWNYKRASIGCIHPNRPKVWAMGGGPRLIDMATRYADGISASSPCAIAGPEALAQIVTEVKQKVEEAGVIPTLSTSVCGSRRSSTMTPRSLTRLSTTSSSRCGPPSSVDSTMIRGLTKALRRSCHRDSTTRSRRFRHNGRVKNARTSSPRSPGR